MIAALASTAAMSVGAVATSVGAHPLVAFFAYATALALLLVRPWRTAALGERASWAAVAVAVLLAAFDRHLFVGAGTFDLADLIAIALLSTIAWPRRRVAVTAGLAIVAYLAVAGALVAGTTYHSDAVVAAHAGAQRVVEGRHPYDGFDLVAELSRFGLPATYATPLEDGTRLRSLQYPALAVLLPAPLIAAGVRDIRALYLVEVLAIFALVLLALAPRWRPLALACCIGNLAILDQFVNAGVDPLWALLVLGAWLARRSGVISAVLLGLALAARQPAWLIAPFLIAWAWRELGASDALRRAAVALAAALAIHLPFLVTAPAAVFGGILTPALLPLEPWGIGPAKTLADTIGPVVPRPAFVLAAAAAYLAALWAFATRRLARGPLVLPLLPLWLSWRALQSYFALLPLFALVDDGYDRVDADR